MQNSTRRPWTREEFILALDLYFRIPFGQINKNNPDIIKLAKLIGRTPSSVGMRLCNFVNCDSNLKERGIKGLAGGQQQCQPYWDEFANRRGDLMSAAIQSRISIIESIPQSDDEYYKHISEWDNLVNEMYDYQFQTIVKKNYHNRCAISGLKITQLLVATHIVPAAEDENDSMKTSNGICLSLIYARAFVEGLIGFDENYKIHLSNYLKKHQFDNSYYALFKKYEGTSLVINDVVVKPDTQFLQWHMDTVFNKSIN